MTRRVLPIPIPKCATHSVYDAIGDPWWQKRTGWHFTAQKGRDLLGQEFDDALVIAVVRHPLDRMVSWWAYHTKCRTTIEEWVEKNVLNPPNAKAALQKSLPQIGWMRGNDGEILVDLVVQLERREEDWRVVEDIAGRKMPWPEEKKNRSTHAPWEEVISDELRAVLLTHFREDAERWYPELLRPSPSA